jgi:crossover junction endodeoxyribonuclease RusA
MAYTITLPWPDRHLSPNARVHWAEKARRGRNAKVEGWTLAIRDGAHNLRWPAATVDITFHPPDKRRRDLDNMLASCKAAFDGIAQATGIDDSLWTLTIARGAPVKGGAVVVVMREDDWLK